MSDGFEIKVCHHVFCATCMTTYVATKIRQNIVKVTCPTPKCPSELKPRHLQTILPREVIDRWETARCESIIAESQKTYCPFKDCSVLLVDDGGEVVTSAECPSCHRLFCAQFRVPWHGMMTCREFQRKKNMNKNEQDLDNKFFKLAEKKKWQKCPKCKMFVQRRSGCEHIKCRCGRSFCYHCGDKWYSGHICKKHRPSS
ncbi:unnamed protein product [Cuscuta campestris]|uniref:RBR-type E3 ubiquitin transferase n=1 Tax=Cuscuta campestris TaxID=132261 RepID=A0A484NNA9_9ASTE|nr:unnamed protein product [Cuscuta campestris]